MKDIKVSVIIPIYNAERYLEESLNGVLNQTLKDIEIICIDDGSTDSSLDILNHYAEEDDRIIILCQEHSNAGKARNRGLEIAKGKYLSFLDADDIYELDMLEEAYITAVNNSAEIVVFRSDRFNENTGFYEESLWTINTEMFLDDIRKGETFSHKNTKNIFYLTAGWTWDKLFSNSYIRNCNLLFQEQPKNNDAFFVFGAMAAAQRITMLDTILIHKRVNNRGSISTEYANDDDWTCPCEFLVKLRGWLKEKGLLCELGMEFDSFAVFFLKWNLDEYINKPIFTEVYKGVKEIYLANTGLMKSSEKSFYMHDDYVWLETIKNQNAAYYRFKRMVTRKDGNYLFPFELVPKGSRIILYGAGVVGMVFYKQIKYSKWCDIVSWVDANPQEKANLVRPTEDILLMNYNMIIIAVREKKIAESIIKQIIDNGISEEKIIWRSPEIELLQ